jgi:hypothetical protein
MTSPYADKIYWFDLGEKENADAKASAQTA